MRVSYVDAMGSFLLCIVNHATVYELLLPNIYEETSKAGKLAVMVFGTES